MKLSGYMHIAQVLFNQFEVWKNTSIKFEALSSICIMYPHWSQIRGDVLFGTDSPCFCRKSNLKSSWYYYCNIENMDNWSINNIYADCVIKVFIYHNFFLLFLTKDILNYINIYRGIVSITMGVFQVPLPFYAVK